MYKSTQQRGRKHSTGLKQQCICYRHFVVDPTNPEGIISRQQTQNNPYDLGSEHAGESFLSSLENIKIQHTGHGKGRHIIPSVYIFLSNTKSIQRPFRIIPLSLDTSLNKKSRKD